MSREFEQKSTGEITPPYHHLALGNIKRELTDQGVTRGEGARTLLKFQTVLSAVDREMFDNYYPFESSDGTTTFYTIVSVENVRKKVAGKRKESPMGEVHVIFPPFNPGGSPFSQINPTYDRVVRELNSEREVCVITLGLPNSFGGRFTDEWLARFENEGFKVFGEYYAQLLRTILPKDLSNVSLQFQGDSMGTIIAYKTLQEMIRQELPDESPNLAALHRTRFLFNNPTAHHNPTGPKIGGVSLSPQMLQVGIGFLAETGLRLLFDKKLQHLIANEQQFLGQLETVLTQKGLYQPFHNADDRIAQDKRNKELVTTMRKHLLSGTPIHTHGFRTYIAQAGLDPTRLDPDALQRVASDFFKKVVGKETTLFSRAFSHGNTVGVAVNQFHYPDRGDAPKAWMRAMVRFEKDWDFLTFLHKHLTNSTSQVGGLPA